MGGRPRTPSSAAARSASATSTSMSISPPRETIDSGGEGAAEAVLDAAADLRPRLGLETGVAATLLSIGNCAGKISSCSPAGPADPRDVTAGTRFLRLMTVFFMATGRGTPCSLWYRPATPSERQSLALQLIRTSRLTTRITLRSTLVVPSPQRRRARPTIPTTHPDRYRPIGRTDQRQRRHPGTGTVLPVASCTSSSAVLTRNPTHAGLRRSRRGRSPIYGAIHET
jgi:hypothetical protein